MMPNEEFCSIKSISEKFESPILILSTVVGRGVFTIGEALEQQLSEKFKVTHKPIEELVSEQTVSEDLKRYKFISNRLPWLLYLIYKVPIFYYRKYAREKWFSKTDVPRLRQLLEAGKFKTVVCLSHRPAFWTAVVQRRSRFPVSSRSTTSVRSGKGPLAPGLSSSSDGHGRAVGRACEGG